MVSLGKSVSAHHESVIETAAKATEKWGNPQDFSLDAGDEAVLFTFLSNLLHDLEQVSVDLAPVDGDPAHVMQTSDQESTEAAVKDELVADLLKEVSRDVSKEAADGELSTHLGPHRNLLL